LEVIILLQQILQLCRTYPELLIFLSLAGGYFVGKIKVHGFNIGSTAGVLIVALIIGQINVQISPLIKAVSFALFIFTIGYKVGPEFFGAIKKEGLKYIILTCFTAIIALVTAVILGKLFHFDPGTTAGMFGGGMTQSSVIGTADGAIRHLSLSAAGKSLLESNVAIAYAITYIFGTAGLILFFKLAPRLMRINLKQEAHNLEKAMSGEEENPDLFYWTKRVSLRAYKIENNKVVGKSIHELEAMFPERIVVDQIKRGKEIFTPDHSTTFELGDIISLLGVPEEFSLAINLLGPEVFHHELLNVEGEILDVCVLNSQIAGKTLGELAEKYDPGCFLKKITRQGHEIPITNKTVIKKCDVLQISGTKEDVERLVKVIGYPERSTSVTDLVMVGIGCFLGTLLGLAAVPVFGVPVTLGVGGGVLVSGLIFGWLRVLHPTFGQIPTGAQWIFIDLGLNLFIACVGLIAGPKAFHAIKTSGLDIFFAGIVMTLTPTVLGLIFGKYILKLNPVLLLGALTGAGTVTAALNALKEEADSTVPALGYTVPYAFANVLLTVWGTLIVYLM